LSDEKTKHEGQWDGGIHSFVQIMGQMLEYFLVMEGEDVAIEERNEKENNGPQH